MPTNRRAHPKNLPPELSEEIQRIQDLLRRLDEILAQRDDVSIKELAQAVTTAGVGGRSIAQLRKFARELERAVNDNDYELARESMFAMLAKLEHRRAKGEGSG